MVQFSPRMKPVHIIGVPLDLGGNRRGVDMGPSAFRIAGIGERLAALGIDVTDAGDLLTPIPEVRSSGDPRKKYIREIARVCERLYKTSLTALEKGGLPVVLGGDHSLAAGSVAATAELPRIGGFTPKVLAEHTVLIGIRNLDEREKESVRASGAHVFTMKDIDRSGIASIVERALSIAGS